MSARHTKAYRQLVQAERGPGVIDEHARQLDRAANIRREFKTHPGGCMIEYVSAYGRTSNLSERSRLRELHGEALYLAREARS